LIVNFDILLRSQASDADVAATVYTIDEFRPSPDAIEECRRWLTLKGITCHPTGFGLACSAPETIFISLFPKRRDTRPPRENEEKDESIGEFEPPNAIAHLIDQITLSQMPDLY